MSQFRILAMTYEENKRVAEAVGSAEELNYLGMVKLDEKGINKAMNTQMDALVIMEKEVSKEQFALLQKLRIARKHLLMILVVDAFDVEILQDAMECGVSKVLTSDKEIDVIVKAIVDEINKKTVVESETEVIEYDAKVISVFGTKGGIGKTTISVNMATALAMSGKKVAMLDLDLQFGDLSVFFDVQSSDTIYDLISEGNYNAATVNSYLVEHSSGVKVLLAPPSPEYAETVKPAHIEKIISSIRNSFDYIVIDLGPGLDETSIKTLELSSTIYYVTNPEISTLKNSRVCMNVLGTLELSNKVKFVLNKDGDSLIKKKDAEEVLNKDMSLVLPLDMKNAISAINRGVPLVLATPKSKFSKALKKYISREEI